MGLKESNQTNKKSKQIEGNALCLSLLELSVNNFGGTANDFV